MGKKSCVIMKNVIICLVLLLSLALGVMPLTDQSLQRWNVVTFSDCLSAIAGSGGEAATVGGDAVRDGSIGAVAVGVREDSSVVVKGKPVTVARQAAR